MNRLWQETLAHLEQTLNPQHFSTWIKPIRFVRVEKDLIQLEVPNRFVRDWIRDHYVPMIRETVSRIGAVAYRIQLEIKSNSQEKESDVSEIETPRNAPLPAETPRDNKQREWNGTGNINSKYVFDEFVAGSSNQFAYAAAMAVANNPATTYNPLFIYGGVGLGKTHLVNAIGNAIMKKNPGMRVCYYTSENL
jgi:chromosomal replication initiator protein